MTSQLCLYVVVLMAGCHTTDFDDLRLEASQ